MKRILICDDEHMIREFLEMLIEDDIDQAVEVISAEDGTNALSILEKVSAFDLIICDMNMPGANGDVVHKFNQNKDKSPFIMLSGDGNDFTKAIPGFTQENSCFVVAKPWDSDELISVINHLI